MVHIRRAVTFAPVWDDTLIWYERAVREMLDRAADDVTSWSYQAAIHGTTAIPVQQSWNSCEHGGWYFFPWHRGYLAAFEAIVRNEVQQLGGPDSWALPYWNYERAGMGSLPPAFRLPQRPDGHDNALFTTKRLRQVNAGTPLLSLLSLLGPNATLSSAAGMAEPSFSSGAVSNGFGGGPTPSSFQADAPSDIEAFLHGNVHVLVGLGGGLMSRFRTAAQDPVFWLHHANIDRLWAEWASMPGHTNPDQATWANMEWTLFTPQHSITKTHPRDVVNTVTQLDYGYDTLPAPAPPEEVEEAPMVDAVADDAANGGDETGPDLEPVGWSPELTLDGRSSITTHVEVDQASLDSVASSAIDALDDAQPVRSYLEISDIEAADAPGILYGVYVHQEGADADAVTDQLVGIVSFFGLENLPPRRDRHEHRMRYVFDVTDIVGGLDQAELGAQGFAVTFRPLGPAELDAADGLDAADVATPSVPVSIGRVALLMG